MSKFYTSCIQYGNKILVRGKNAGKRYQTSEWYKPRHYVIHNNESKLKPSKFREIMNNRPVSEIKFDSIKEAKQFVDSYKDVESFSIYGFNRYAYTYIYDNYGSDIDYYFDQINIGTLDIETKSDTGFPDVDLADKEIIAITIQKKNRIIVFGCQDYNVKNENVIYVKCKDEEELLNKFLETWEALDLDIVTGWNIEFFDIPYIVNRISRVLGEDSVKKLSPWKIVRSNTRYRNNREVTTYDLFGIAILDYLQAYQKFTYVKQETYKLDFIAQIELNEKKVDFRSLGYANLHDLYTRNFDLFIDYNIKDVTIVHNLNNKLGLLEQIVAIAYMARVNYTDAFTSVLIWDVIINNYLNDHNYVVPTNVKREHKLNQIMGAYVKEPLLGNHDWVVSFDLNSLYPSLIMQYNISPETIGEFYPALKNEYGHNIEKLVNKEHLNDSRITSIFDNNKTFTPNGATFKKDKRGFLPELMELMYTDRTKYKNTMISKKKELELVKEEMKKRGLST